VAISSRLLTEGEHVVIDTRTHVKALLFPLFLLVVVLAVALFLDGVIGNAILSDIVWVLALVIVLWWVVRPFLNWLTATYTITDRRLITRHGIVSRQGHDIPLSRISDVAYELGLVDRMLGCGTLLISDASTNGQVRLHDIPNVEETQRTLTDLLAGTHSTSRDDDGT